ncbi:hypothetical protein D2E44_19380 [Mycobacteroides abscessus]|nr:hypothetical protein MA4S0726RB_4638 [Mycobacteroides abscessus 4S-0726-RB]EIU00833.1 hypothetical protein MA4S0726RA_0145 [Mycobacteroides abscessus 4S-0726-RA]EIU03076.1 hypothetical protein MA4S0303_0421 [Mycobacteroides abscessus 4S-0303]EIV09940.1 hypothetical protein MA4S0206_1873 [Mycobacteroides abscessus 4S-0206]EIV52082.1 hypothetical protein MA4S0116R_0415 [Mycobacteroides abscessus 4S-0116-R]EIV61268.1 hypothetical protein MA4S0116S_4179 [Mycobacteroides abscessus 4S-0116-S]RIS
MAAGDANSPGIEAKFVPAGGAAFVDAVAGLFESWQPVTTATTNVIAAIAFKVMNLFFTDTVVIDIFIDSHDFPFSLQPEHAESHGSSGVEVNFGFLISELSIQFRNVYLLATRQYIKPDYINRAVLLNSGYYFLGIHSPAARVKSRGKFVFRLPNGQQLYLLQVAVIHSIDILLDDGTDLGVVICGT